MNGFMPCMIGMRAAATISAVNSPVPWRWNCPPTSEMYLSDAGELGRRRVQRDEPVAAFDEVEQRLLLLRRDRLVIAVDHERVVVAEPGGGQRIGGRADVGQLNAAPRQRGGQQREHPRRVVRALLVLTEEQNPDWPSRGAPVARRFGGSARAFRVCATSDRHASASAAPTTVNRTGRDPELRNLMADDLFLLLVGTPLAAARLAPLARRGRRRRVTEAVAAGPPRDPAVVRTLYLVRIAGTSNLRLHRPQVEAPLLVTAVTGCRWPCRIPPGSRRSAL